MKAILITATTLILMNPVAQAQLQRGGGEGHGGPDRIEMQCSQDPVHGKGLSIQIMQYFGDPILKAVVLKNNEMTAIKNEPVKVTPATLPGTPGEKPRLYKSKNTRLEVFITGMPVHHGPNERAGVLTLFNSSGKSKKLNVTCFFFM